MAGNRFKRARGGKVFYSGKGSNVEKEAEEEKRGGAVHKKKDGGAVNPFAKGGHVAHHMGHHGPETGFHKKDGGPVPGQATGGRADKRKRGGGIPKMFRRGGKVGSDLHPFSSAGGNTEKCGPHSKSGV